MKTLLLIIGLLIHQNCLATPSADVNLELELSSIPVAWSSIKIWQTVVFTLSGAIHWIDWMLSQEEALTLSWSVNTEDTLFDCENYNFWEKKYFSDSFVGISINCTLKSGFSPTWTQLARPDFSEIYVKSWNQGVVYQVQHKGFKLASDVMYSPSVWVFSWATLTMSLHPNRLLNWKTNSNWVLEQRADKADLMKVAFVYSQTPNPTWSIIYPNGVKNKQKAEVTWETQACNDIINHYTSCTVSKNYLSQCDNEWLCSLSVIAERCQATSYLDIVNYDENHPYIVDYYNPISNAQEVNHLDSLLWNPVIMDIKADLPTSYPQLIDNKTWLNAFNWTYNLTNIFGKDANAIMSDWIKLNIDKDLTARSLTTWRLWVVSIWLVWGSVIRTRWQYVRYLVTAYCHYDYYVEYDCKNSDDPCYIHKVKKLPYNVYYYRWKKISEEVIPFPQLNDSANVDVYSSSSWYQTKFGNIGTNNQVQLNYSENSAGFNSEKLLQKFPNSINYQLGDDLTMIWWLAKKNADVGFSLTNNVEQYMPQNEYSWQFMVYADLKQLNSSHSFQSKAGWELDLSWDKHKYGYDSRWDEYDRVSGARNYSKDLLNRQYFGEVINFGIESPSKWGIGGNYPKFSIVWKFTLTKGKVYYFPAWSTLVMGDKNQDVILDWWSAKIFVDGDVVIDGNILYGSNSVNNYLDIPNLRIESLAKISVSPHVEYIESQLKAKQFDSGSSDLQLKIYWDVIAEKVDFKRLPTWVYDPENFEANPPSELIIEDMRKYIVPPPWDTVLREAYNSWQQVDPLSWKFLEPF